MKVIEAVSIACIVVGGFAVLITLMSAALWSGYDRVPPAWLVHFGTFGLALGSAGLVAFAAIHFAG